MEEKARELAGLLRVLANENRLLVLCALLERPMTVGELAEAVPGITQPALSQHLHALRQAGLVEGSRSGQFVTYALADERVRALFGVLKALYCAEEEG